MVHDQTCKFKAGGPLLARDQTAAAIGCDYSCLCSLRNIVTPARESLVVIGNGMAGTRAVEEILARAPNRFEITIFGEERHGNYNRIQLSGVLGGFKEEA